jgi:hypothetical protein
MGFSNGETRTSYNAVHVIIYHMWMQINKERWIESTASSCSKVVYRWNCQFCLQLSYKSNFVPHFSNLLIESPKFHLLIQSSEPQPAYISSRHQTQNVTFALSRLTSFMLDSANGKIICLEDQIKLQAC